VTTPAAASEAFASPLAAFDLSGRVALVTGAGSGIGRATAEHLAAVGASLLLADVDPGALAEVETRVKSSGAPVTSTTLDIADRSAVDAAVDLAVERFGRLDVMANVAGIPGDGVLENIEEDDLDRVLAVNVKGTFFGCQAAARIMVEQGSGSIINVASAAVDCPVGGNSMYALSKAAIAMLTMSLAAELGPRGVRINAIAPGPTLTRFTLRELSTADHSKGVASYEERIEAMRRMSPIGRVGEPSDQALQILYLASDASRFVTGAILRANGGVGMVW
jgi:3-oxoacyl-[acyl-carrier protein] reductase